MKPIATPSAPAAIGPYSQAIEVNGLIYTSGQLPIDPATGAFPEGGIEAQTRQSLTNVKSILEAAGSDMSHVVKTLVFLADMSDFAAMNGVYADFFLAALPCPLCRCRKRTAQGRYGGDRSCGGETVSVISLKAALATYKY